MDTFVQIHVNQENGSSKTVVFGVRTQPGCQPLLERTESGREFDPSPTRNRRVGSGHGRNGFKLESPRRACVLANPCTRANSKTPAACTTGVRVNHFGHVTLAACVTDSRAVRA